MKLEGTYTIAAPRPIVWALLNDPAVLARMLPGCERLTPIGDNRFEAVIKAGVGAIKGIYTGTAAIEDPKPQSSYTLQVEGKGAGGFLRGRGAIALADQGVNTEVTIDGEAQVGGLIAAVGQRLLGGAARMLLGEFFRALDAEARKQAG